MSGRWRTSRRATSAAALVVAIVSGAAGPASPQAPAEAPVTDRTELVGHLDLRAEGYTADLWVHRNTAYLGAAGDAQACPGHGVRIVDVTAPTEPRVLSTVADGGEFPGTSAEDIWAGSVFTGSFRGDVMAVGIQLCRGGDRAGGAFRGLALYDVTDPADPRRLAALSTGAGTRGVHELDIARRPDGRILLAGAVSGSWNHTGGRRGDVRIVDITDPARPLEVADWDFRRDAPPDVRGPVIADRGTGGEMRAHGATLFDRGRKVAVAHWDAGLVLLDLADPGQPAYLGRFGYRPGDEGNAHSVAFFDGDRRAVLDDEAGPFPFFGPQRQPTWGHQRILDVADPAAPRQVGAFLTGSTHAGRGGFFSVHRTVVRGRLAYAAWYSDGVRVTSLADPSEPTEIGSFVPPPSPDRLGRWGAPDGASAFPLVWGVAVAGGLVFASDVNSGLWIFRREVRSPRRGPVRAR